ncbi:hypothetical protein K437DRAFT_256427 [Tilletiaria anomala UBC 951]|uniref:Uncharacterized protein n=1 Tax=Tilletiaria anomala (strain ATCC 24038 / CBS 436.72 / UBC 951) TaxID=1037660 RepID=A0A066VWR9_TILAU|nr:uncharacterized protein K437DRAFT_256427 [Tilletiaria anomala UBC 951]KDN45906.1 hypothetical protein K437DRAFT_256427 [Tilletiaria anomala UBC 951]
MAFTDPLVLGLSGLVVALSAALFFKTAAPGTRPSSLPAGQAQASSAAQSLSSGKSKKKKSKKPSSSTVGAAAEDSGLASKLKGTSLPGGFTSDAGSDICTAEGETSISKKKQGKGGKQSANKGSKQAVQEQQREAQAARESQSYAQTAAVRVHNVQITSASSQSNGHGNDASNPPSHDDPSAVQEHAGAWPDVAASSSENSQVEYAPVSAAPKEAEWESVSSYSKKAARPPSSSGGSVASVQLGNSLGAGGSSAPGKFASKNPFALLKEQLLDATSNSTLSGGNTAKVLSIPATSSSSSSASRPTSSTSNSRAGAGAASNASSGSSAMSKKQRQNAARREAQKAAKADVEAARLQALAQHKRQLEAERIKDFFSKGAGVGRGGAGSASGGQKASVNQQGHLVWD